MSDLRFPIGHFQPEPYAEALREAWLQDIASLPANLEAAVAGLTEDQWNTPYREGGWTVRQVVHHVADSHINAFCRIKLTLTEDNPTIRPYEEGEWVVQADAQLPVANAFALLNALHQRMYALLANAGGADWQRTYIHPASGKQHTLWFLMGSYAWHGRHHTAHITALRKRMGW